MARGELRERERVLARQELFLPCLDLLLPRRRERLHDAIDERTGARVCTRDSLRRDEDGRGVRRRGGSRRSAIEPQREDLLVFVLLALLDNRQLRHLRRWLYVPVVLDVTLVSLSIIR